MKKQVTRQEYQAASIAISQISPALATLGKVDHQAVDKETFKRIQGLHSVLEAIHAENKAVIAQGDQQYQGRPEDLIRRAADRMVTEIPLLIEREEKHLAHRISSYNFEVGELKRRGFTDAKINQIVQPISQSEIDESHARVAILKTEAEALKAFLDDAPRFDIEILKGTPFYTRLIGEAV